MPPHQSETDIKASMERESYSTPEDPKHLKSLVLSPAPQERKLRYESKRRERCESFKNKLGESAESLNKQGLIVPFFECVRERCYDLYEKTLAYSTVTLFAQAAKGSIKTYFDGAAPVDAGLLKSIKLLFEVLLDDLAGFQGINMMSSGAVAKASENAISHLHELSSSSEEYRKLACGWRKELQRRFEVTAEKLPKFYGGIRKATRAIEQYENLISRLNAGEGQPVLRAGSTEVSRHIARALDELQGRIDELLRGITPDDDIIMYSILDGYVSELVPWRELLATLKRELEEGGVLFQITTLKLRYCFPFAVDLDDEHLPDEIRPRIGGLTGAETPGITRSQLEARLNNQLKILMPCNFPLDAKPLQLTEFWQGAGTGMVGGLRVELPELVDTKTTDRWDKVWIELSRLGNHCLCIQRTLKKPTPMDLYQALRAPGYYVRDDPGYYARDEKFRYQLQMPSGNVLNTRPEPTREKGWCSIDDFAHDLIELTAVALCHKSKPGLCDGPLPYCRGSHDARTSRRSAR